MAFIPLTVLSTDMQSNQSSFLVVNYCTKVDNNFKDLLLIRFDLSDEIRLKKHRHQTYQQNSTML